MANFFEKLPIAEKKEKVKKEPKEDFEKGEKEKIELIEKSSFLDTNEKIDLVLFLLGKKQTALMGDHRIARKRGEKEKFLNYLTEKKEKIEELLNELEFVYRLGECKIEDDIIGYNIEIGKDEENLSKLIKACEKKDNKELGLILGYPETAAEAFPNKLLDFREWRQALPKEEKGALIKSNVLKFLNFQPSERHWREELESVKEHQNLIKEKAPFLYEKIIKDEEDPLKKLSILKTKFRGILNRLEYYKRGLRK